MALLIDCDEPIFGTYHIDELKALELPYHE